MSTLTMPAERIAAAGCSRAVASRPGVVSVAEYAGTAGGAAGFTFRGWDANPAPVMAAAPQVKSTPRHLTPARWPEEASP